ncbi:hypothetical protein OAQ71_00110 [bacterium]|nr:hypothetical protein [bacterium]
MQKSFESEAGRRLLDVQAREVEVREGVLVFADGELVEPDNGAVDLRDLCDQGLETGRFSDLRLEFDGRSHRVTMSERQVARAVAALRADDLPWRRAVDYHTLIYTALDRDLSVHEELIAARDAVGARWMAAMIRDEWEVVVNERKARMADGEVVDFRGPPRRGFGERASLAPLDQVAVTTDYPDDAPPGANLVVQVSVENRASEVVHQVLVVLDSPELGLLNVAIGAVLPGATITRFVQLRPGRDSGARSMTARAEQWTSVKKD